MKFRAIRKHESEFDIRMMCRALAVSRAGYYAWRDREPSNRANNDAEIVACMTEHHVQSRMTYGRRRLRAALRNDGVRVSGKRVRRLMRGAGLVVQTRRRYRATTNSRHRRPVADNGLNRRFAVSDIGERDRYWSWDISVLQQQRTRFVLS